ncbi:hypothetical protein [Aeromicrobium duanguangcaii]|uniref:hypothetical protein n=1 Tax=Aeromicrobium duanguangcaii TaxID=2968086 RepID=UPI002017FE2F|nr:hypothetical protein [Aeromicrobium duanguangcaii]MCL3836249.1 hypothetical protein [Aeromicrobium duanguangcaii]
MALVTVTVLAGFGTGIIDGSTFDLHDVHEPPSLTEPESSGPDGVAEPRDATTCVDVTSQDHNWDNDMLCTRPDGSTFHTSYEGAEQFG